MNKVISLIISILTIILLTSCAGIPMQRVEVTRLVPQTVQVTVITTPVSPTSVNNTLESENAVYFEGISVIAQYYKLLDQALYKDAYQLLGASAKLHAPNLEDYIASSTRAFKSVKIIAIQPYDEWVKQQGNQPPLDPAMANVFFVQIIAEGEGIMSGSAVSGEVQTLFITVVRGDDRWMIDSFSTGLTP